MLTSKPVTSCNPVAMTTEQNTATDYRRQWSQSFPTLEQGTNKFSKGPEVDGPDRKDWPPEYCNGVSSYASETNGIMMGSVHPLSLKGGGSSVKGTKNSSENIRSSFAPETNGIMMETVHPLSSLRGSGIMMETVHPLNSLRGGGVSVKGTKNSSENMQSFKSPEAFVAFAQAVAKTNGEPEKYLHGWPLMSPTQMQKCDKCSREFCSSINYRRHIRVHRRSLNVDKDSAKKRDFLGAFWDKLSLDKAEEIISFEDVVLEEVAGPSIIKALASYTRKLGFSSLPHVYVKAGASLLDVVQARPPRFPLSSQEFFSILDDASEKTFLCAGNALSVQKFVFDGDAGKIGLEMKNIVACTSFLVEQKLVKAWIADKDAEALRCQKLLVEEEEAAQKRQAELMERKRLKKLRQKEQRAREQTDGDKVDINGSAYTADCGSSAEMSYLPSETGLNSADVLSNSLPLPPMPAQFLDAVAEVGIICDLKHSDTDMDGSADLGSSQNVDAEAHIQHRESQRKITAARRSSPKLSKNTPNGFHPVQILALKSVSVQKHNYRDQRSASLSNGHKVWTPKTKLGSEEESSNVRGLLESEDQLDQSSCSEVLIGSISVILGDGGSPQQDDFSAPALDHSVADHQNLRRNSAQVKHVKPDSSQNAVERSMVKLWRPVSRHDIGGPVVVQGDRREDTVYGISENAVDLSSESPEVCSSSDVGSSGCKDSPIVATDGASTDLRIFSSCIATTKAFLEQRWKGALAVGLVLSSETEPPDCQENLGCRTVADVLSAPSEGCMQSTSSDIENQLAGAGPAVPIAATAGSSTPKFRAKAEKGSWLKYVPKQRTSS